MHLISDIHIYSLALYIIAIAIAVVYNTCACLRYCMLYNGCCIVGYTMVYELYMYSSCNSGHAYTHQTCQKELHASTAHYHMHDGRSIMQELTVFLQITTF